MSGYESKKVRKMAKIRKRYNQVPHLTQDTTWDSHKNTINITNKSQEPITFFAKNSSLIQTGGPDLILSDDFELKTFIGGLTPDACFGSNLCGFFSSDCL